LFFKYFFDSFIHPDVKHESKYKKIVNSGLVSFTLQQCTDGENFIYNIDADSIINIYGGFESK
jgi:hypothetical protein